MKTTQQAVITHGGANNGEVFLCTTMNKTILITNTKQMHIYIYIYVEMWEWECIGALEFDSSFDCLKRRLDEVVLDKILILIVVS